ncbi:carbohydrate kinase [Paracoccus sp. 11-3]|uniref:Carbohydrate kinase n=1 Tax=Paracoccus amoyensis TaxID=2760093 RepID=A0A926GC43_9RHOB|nr:FGGY-family carbohydrate kinase [Paracoccus amoyensis]MBC9247251.1 carbohydrate kinase [Paracoccus amoyensis]
MPLLLGIDNGLTVTKAVIFDETGRVLSTARRRVAQSIPKPRHVERDMGDLWAQTAAAIHEAICNCPRPASEIVAVAATAHGDGLYLLDQTARPLGPGILSLDSRAGHLADDWMGDGTAETALHRTGQMPHASAPSAILGWMRVHDPDRFSRIAHVLACKDWLTYCLTGHIGTDLTEASTSFTDVQTQAFAPDILPIFGLETLAQALPTIADPDQIVGTVSADAARVTGLTQGTPVVAGLHDVTASALGAGGYGQGTVAIVAGTYSINETVTALPVTDPRWFCRNGLRRGEWNAMSISPASATNYDWFLDTFCGPERRAAEEAGRAFHAEIIPEIEDALSRPSTVLFHPFLFGSPHGPDASAGFLGLHGWHNRSDLLRAVIEGIAFNHRHHVDALRDGFGPSAVRLTGGISRSPVFAQLFADALGMPVSVSDTDEAAAWGAALCAGSGVGLFTSPHHDPREMDALTRQYHPDQAHVAQLDRRYDVFNQVTKVLSPVWPRIEALAKAAE